LDDVSPERSTAADVQRDHKVVCGVPEIGHKVEGESVREYFEQVHFEAEGRFIGIVGLGF